MIVHPKSSREPDASVETCKKLLQNRSFLVSSGASETEIETRIRQEGRLCDLLFCKGELNSAKLNYPFRFSFNATV